MKGAALLETMAQRVAQECDRIIDGARREKEAILDEARVRALATREATLQATHAEMERLDLRWRQKAEAEAAKAELSLRKDTSEAVLDSVRNEIRALADGAEFGATLDALLDELMRVAEGDYVVLAPARRVDHVKQWLASHDRGDRRVEASDELWDGVAVQDPQRTYRISNTLTGRFARVEQRARKLSMKTLFPQDERAPGGGS